MTTIYLLRHGQTELNLAGLVQGWSDSPLTVEGRGVVEKAGAALENIHFDYVYTSDMIRTVQTAKVILDCNKTSGDAEIVQVAGLREINFGKYESGPDTAMLAAGLRPMGFENTALLFNGEGLHRDFLNHVAASDETGVAENYEKGIGRFFSAFDSICVDIEGKGGGNIMVVAHGTMISMLLIKFGYFLRKPVKNASITTITYDGKYKVLCANAESV